MENRPHGLVIILQRRERHIPTYRHSGFQSTFSISAHRAPATFGGRAGKPRPKVDSPRLDV